mmetsp:Transcript_85755/g.251069  ORF Transcript_85755/g.251069 Transcript_85755/m.251069 type:complete len:241 (-) Transcript_85755:1096-1818(-)
MASCLLSSSLRLRETSTCFLCSCASFRPAAFFISNSSCSCVSRTLHHSPRKRAVSTSSARSRSRWARLRSSCWARLDWTSDSQRAIWSAFWRRLRSSWAAFSCTCLSTRSSSSFCMSARRLACASIIAFRACCFCWKTSSSFFFRSCSIFSFLAAYPWIFSSSCCCRKSSAFLTSSASASAFFRASSSRFATSMASRDRFHSSPYLRSCSSCSRRRRRSRRSRSLRVMSMRWASASSLMT